MESPEVSSRRSSEPSQCPQLGLRKPWHPQPLFCPRTPRPRGGRKDGAAARRCLLSHEQASGFAGGRVNEGEMENRTTTEKEMSV